MFPSRKSCWQTGDNQIQKEEANLDVDSRKGTLTDIASGLKLCRELLKTWLANQELHNSVAVRTAGICNILESLTHVNPLE